MPERPYTVLSCCISMDGYLDDASEQRLVLSGPADLDRVDEVRAGSDAILVGAGTIRADNPRLLVRDEARRAARVACGLTPTPIKVTLTERAKLDPSADFFTAGDTEKLVYCAGDRADEARTLLGAAATVVPGDRPIRMRRLSEDLYARGVQRMMVEGGGAVLTQFLAQDLADELHLAIAPILVGDSRATRFVEDLPWTSTDRVRLVETRPVGDVVLLRYALSDRCAG